MVVLIRPGKVALQRRGVERLIHLIMVPQHIAFPIEINGQLLYKGTNVHMPELKHSLSSVHCSYDTSTHVRANVIGYFILANT